MPRRQHTVVDLTDHEHEARDDLRKQFEADWPLYAKSCLRILDRNPKSPSTRRIPFEFNACQAALWELEKRIGDVQQRLNLSQGLPSTRRPIKIIALKARKVGVSTYVQGRLNHICEFNRDTEALDMAHRADAADNIAEIQRRFFNFFPKVAHPVSKIAVDPREPLSDIGKIIKWNPLHGSKMTIKTAGSGTGRSKGASRSYTYNAMHISEAAWFGDSSELAATLAAATPDAIMFQESTANGRANGFHDDWERALWIEDLERMVRDGEPPPDNWSEFVRFFWPWFADPEYQLPVTTAEQKRIEQTLDETEQRLIDEHKVSYPQLKWRRRKIAGECQKQTEYDPEEYFQQEYPSEPEEAFLMTGNAVFHQGKLKGMAQAARKLGKAAVEAGGRFGRWFRWEARKWELRQSAWTNADYVEFEPPKKNHWYVMGIDTAEGLEHGDHSVISIFDRTGMTFIKEVARYVSKTYNPEELGELAVHLANYFNKAFIVAERNQPGNVTCLAMFNLEYNNLYMRDDEETITPGDNQPNRFKIGFSTNKQSKALIVNNAATGLKDDQIFLRSERAIQEWTQFSLVDGKLTAPSGKHDDCVIADCLANFGHWGGKAPIVNPNESPTDRVPEDPTSYEGRLKEHVQRQLKQIRRTHQRKHEARLAREQKANAARFRRHTRGLSVYD